MMLEYGKTEFGMLDRWRLIRGGHTRRFDFNSRKKGKLKIQCV